ncbi:MAG: alcohol dehydrogenase catalytic domain-containing protein [Acidimicrobiales bacterium]
MKALVFTRPGVVEIDDVPDVIVAAGEEVVDVELAGICGSELHGVTTPGFRVPPLVMGHEFVGRTSDDRRVAVNPLSACGECDHCRSGQSQLCRTRSLLGVHKSGGFAERVAVPSRSIHELPEGLEWERAALIEPIANAVHAWSRADSPIGKRIGIIGCGAIGIACLEVARSFGAGSVSCADVTELRRTLADGLGADAVGEVLSDEYDVIFDAVGIAPTREMSIERLKPGGTTVWLGLASTISGFDATNAVRFEKSVRGTFAYNDEEFATAVALAPELDLSWSATFALDDGADIFTELMHGRVTPVKALLRP